MFAVARNSRIMSIGTRNPIPGIVPPVSGSEIPNIAMSITLPERSNAGLPLIPPDSDVPICIAVHPVPSGVIMPKISYKPPTLAEIATGFVTSVNRGLSDMAPGKPVS